MMADRDGYTGFPEVIFPAFPTVIVASMVSVDDI